MIVIAVTWLACLWIGITFGAHVGLGLFVLIELRATFAGALQDWRRAEQAAKQQTENSAAVRIN